MVSERPRPEQGVRARVGLRGSATILHLRVIRKRFFLRVDRALRRKHRGDEKGPVRAGILPSRGTVRVKGESLPTRRVPKPRWTQDSAFACRDPNDAALTTGSRSERSILRPITHERRILRHPRPRSESPTRARTRPPVEASFGEQVHSQPQRRSSERRPSRGNAAASEDPAEETQQRAKTQPERLSSSREPTDAQRTGCPASASSSSERSQRARAASGSRAYARTPCTPSTIWSTTSASWQSSK